MTPSQFYAFVDGYTKNVEMESNKKNTELYNLASLIRVAVWEKKMPAFDDVFKSKNNEPMTDDQMYSVVQSLNALFGGNSV